MRQGTQVRCACAARLSPRSPSCPPRTPDRPPRPPRSSRSATASRRARPAAGRATASTSSGPATGPTARTVHARHLLQLRRPPRVRQLVRQRLPPGGRGADQERCDLRQREDQPRLLGRPDEQHLACFAGRPVVQGRSPAGGPAASDRAAEERQAGASEHHRERPRVHEPRDRLHGRVDARLHLQRERAGGDRGRTAGRRERPAQGDRRDPRRDVERRLQHAPSTSSSFRATPRRSRSARTSAIRSRAGTVSRWAAARSTTWTRIGRRTRPRRRS